MRKFSPLKIDHPLIVDKTPCKVCNIIFNEGDEVTLISTVPANKEEAKKARENKSCTYQAEVVHWNCRNKS